MLSRRTLLLLPGCAAIALAQGRLAPSPADMALLDGPERSDFRCRVQRDGPSLGFDLRYQARWEATVRVKDFREQGDLFRLLARITPDDPAGEPLVLTDTAVLPPRKKVRGNDAVFYGGFAVGPGRYRVDWVLRDSRERVCVEHWDLTVKHKDDFALDIRPGQALPLGRFRQSAAKPAPDGPAYTIKVLANFSNTNPARSVLNRQDTAAVGAILSTISREPRFTRFGVIAFNMQEERIFYKSESAGARIDFRQITRGIAGLKLGVIDYERLLDRKSATKFVTRLLDDHLGGEQEHADAVLLVGPKLFLEHKVPKEAIDAIAGSGPPVFYLNYVWSPRRLPWRDSLGDAVKRYGGKEFRITYPKDLGRALAEIVERLDQRRASPSTSARSRP